MGKEKDMKATIPDTHKRLLMPLSYNLVQKFVKNKLFNISLNDLVENK